MFSEDEKSRMKPRVKQEKHEQWDSSQRCTLRFKASKNVFFY